MTRFNSPYSKSCVTSILDAFLPYTQENLTLTFKPSKFFADLAKTEHYHKRSLQNAYYRSINDGLIAIDDIGIPRLTDKGIKRLRPYKPTRLIGDVKLFVIYDIPESDRWKRRRLRLLLHELKFKQVQKSVWVTSYEVRSYVNSGIREYNLSEYVKIFEGVLVS